VSLPFFVSCILSLFPSILCYFLSLGLHSSASASLSLSSFCPAFPRESERTRIKNANSVNWTRLKTLLHAETFLLFLFYTCAGWGVLKRKRNKTAFPGDAIQLNVRVSPLYCVDNSAETCHIDATCKPLDDALALELHITALLMWEVPVLLVELEAKVTCFTTSAYANCKRSHVRCQYMGEKEKKKKPQVTRTNSRGTYRQVYGVI